jgi:uncharacterized protein (TIGR02996 family)
MNAQEQGLLAAVIESPEDDTPRLILADWLQDHDQPERAELIRVQVEQARTEEWTPRHKELSARAEALLTPENVEAWAGALGFNRYPANFRRGFVERDCFSPSRFLDLAPGVFEKAPLRQVDIMTPDAGGDVYTGRRSPKEEALRERVVGSELLAPVRYLTLFDLGPETVRRLTRSRHLGGLEELQLCGGPAADSLETLAATRRLGGLRRLGVSIHDDAPPHSPRDDALATLANSDLARRLTELFLRGLHITDAGLAHLATDRWQSLTSLYLFDNPISDAGVAALLRSPGVARWTSLSLMGKGLTGQSMRAIADCPALANLTTLRLEARRVTARDVTRLLASPHLPRLRQLGLFAINADTVLTAGAEVPETARVRRLVLGEAHRITDAGANALLRTSPLDAVTSIFFGGRPPGVSAGLFDKVVRKLGARFDSY